MRIENQAALARELGLHRSAITRYLARDDWPAAVSRVPPWTQADVEVIREWRLDTLQEDRSAMEDDEDPFWRWRCEHPPIELPMEGGLDKVAEALELPVQVCTAPERDIISGKSMPAADELRGMIARYVIFKGLMIRVCNRLPGWLVGYDRDEIARRMRAEIHDAVGWLHLFFEPDDQDEE